VSVQNFSFPACLEVTEKFVGGGSRDYMERFQRLYGGFQVATMSNLNEVAFELLSVELS